MYPENMAGMATTKRRKRSPPPPVVTPPVVTPPGAGGVMPSGQPQPFTLQMPFGVVLPSTSSQPPQPLLLPFLSGPIPIQPLSMPTSTAPSRPVPIQPLPPSTAPSHPVPHTSTAHYVPHSTLWYRKRRLEKEQAGECVKKYTRKEGTLCGQCGKERLAHNHKQYYGVWWCEEKAIQTHEEWFEQQKVKRTLKQQSKK
eukprot:TRINITY_DN32204_c0_g1_i2.p1 TRINITY_DN32204_c0_g1~~TRINITY_DN32204_c0_g1_i2.p1  ORF type:complete len:198 (+),score=35.90 TRINITY_DN32204_c0_g1_i2:160-753(+)